MKIRRRCKCGCRNITRLGNKFVNGHNRRKWKTHYKSPEYNSWNAMIQRCHGKGCIGYKERGIKVYYKWRKSFDKFLEDMGPKPTSNHTIDRIDGKGNYCPSNCRWATVKEQNCNRKDNMYITYKGKTMLQKDWAKYFGISQGAVASRIARGFPLEEVFSQKDFRKEKR